MATKLFVGNLPYTTTDDQLEQMFSKAGTVVSAVVIKNKFTGRSKGFGFVEMETAEMAQAAISQFNGSKIDGRDIVVNEAFPFDPKPRRFEERRSFGSYRGNRER